METPLKTLNDYLPHLEAWEKSGLAKIEYCHQQGIKYHCFLYWMKRWKAKAEPGKFYPIKVLDTKPGSVPASPAGRFASITLQNRVTIEIHQAVPATYLSELAQSCS